MTFPKPHIDGEIWDGVAVTDLEQRAATSTMVVGLHASDWGNTNSFGASGGLTLAQDIATICQYFRAEAPAWPNLPGVDLNAYYLNEGLKLCCLFPGDNALGWSYNTGGVSMINPTAWASAALTWYKAHCTTANTPWIEVLNEAWGTWFWGSGAYTEGNADAYGTLVKDTWNTFHEWYGTAGPLILANTFAQPGAGQAPLGTTQWWDWLIAAHPDIGDYYDGVIQHPYGGPSSMSAVRSAQGNRGGIAAAHLATGKLVWVTEVGFPTGVSDTSDSRHWSEAQQATNLQDFVYWARSVGYIAGVFVYQYLDEGAPSWYGLVRYGEGGGTVDFSHKPAFDTFAGLVS